MKKLQWNMEEVFYFPETVGVPKDARLVKVKAGFTEKRSEDAVRLSGIYHIAAKVEFAEGERNATLPSDAVFVDDVEMEGETGYFEYAVPLYVDLPPEVEQPIHIEATDIQSTFDGQGAFTVTWNVNCTYGTAPTLANEAEADTSVSEKVSEAEETVAVAVNETPKEKVAAGVQQPEENPVTERSQTEAAPKQTAAEPVQVSQATALHDSSSLNSQDDILSYIAALPDEWTTSRFRSNDIFVKEES